MGNAYIGRIGNDLSLRFSEGGTAWVGVGFAIECRVKENGEWASKPIWTDLKVFGKMAENLCEVAAKGTRLIVIGEMKPSEYRNKDNEVVKGIELVADQVGLDIRFGIG